MCSCSKTFCVRTEWNARSPRSPTAWDARNHFDAVAASGNPPDLILLDLNLPKISGTELLAFIRGRQALANVPIVVWSSARSEREQRALDQFRIARFIAKPTNYAGFMSIGPTLREIIEQAKNRELQ